MYLSKEELIKELERKEKKFINQWGIEISLLADGIFSASKDLLNDEEKGIRLELVNECPSADEFALWFQLKNADELDAISNSMLLTNYLAGRGSVYASVDKVEAELNFQIVKQKTTVQDLSRHFYDELYKCLSLPEQFVSYIEENDELLHKAAMKQGKLR